MKTSPRVFRLLKKRENMGKKGPVSRALQHL
jgi:hypothetical protein